MSIACLEFGTFSFVISSSFVFYSVLFGSLCFYVLCAGRKFVHTMQWVISFVIFVKKCFEFLALDMLRWDALGPWGGSDEGGSGLVGKSKVGSGLCGGVGTIEMQEAPHLQQSRSAERHKEQ